MRRTIRRPPSTSCGDGLGCNLAQWQSQVMVRRSDSFCAKGEIGLKSGEREQESDKRILNRPAALSALFQATEVFKG
jgi:hypothetical protein